MKKSNELIQERGVALIVALFFLLILSLLGLSLLLNTEMENATSGNYSKTVTATYAAQAGLERIKPYLLYDYAEDPEGWANENLLVPFGTPGSSDAAAIGLPGHGYFDLSQGGAITVPRDTPYDVVNALADAQNPTLFAATTTPTYSPEAGYEIMFRNIPPGAPAADQICVQAIGSTGKVQSLGGIGTRGSNILEACYTADILSIWDNIIFSADASGLGGGGAMELHGNIHVLGNEADPGDVVYESKGDHFNCYECGRTKLSDVPFNNLLNAPQAALTTLDAKFRIKNGIADLDNGAACVGGCGFGGGANYAGSYVCTTCPTSPHEGFNSQASEDAVKADEEEGYDIPADIQSIIDFPEVTDPHVDLVTGIGYDNYSDYLIGDEDTSPFQPGTLGLKLRLAFTNPGTTFNLGNSTALADEVWSQKDSIFLFNVNTNTAGVNRAQVPLDPVGMDENPDEGDPIFTPTMGSGFMVVAADVAQGVVLVYKETQSFTRSGVTHPRQVHGFVFAPSSADMTNLALDVDLDGADLDVGDGTENYTPATLDPTQSNNLVRKVVNALWLMSQKSCGTPCYTSASASNFHSTIQSTQISHDDTDTGRLDIGNLGNFFVAFGVIQTTDHFNVATDGVTYMGRVTMFIDEPDANPGSGSACDFSCAELAGDLRPIESYQIGQWYAFPCQNNMGVLASDDIDFEKQPHTDKVGAFYASDTTYVEKQFQILGAMVSDIWDFRSGGNPDMFQALEMARCLPPYMIGDETVPVLGTTRFVER